MKKQIALLFAFLLLFSFSTAESALELEEVESFREAAANFIDAGTFLRLGSLPVQNWTYEPAHSSKESPLESDNQEVLILTYLGNPDYTITFRYFKTDLTIGDFLEGIPDKTNMPSAFIQNGLPVTKYSMDSNGQLMIYYTYYLDGFVLHVIFPDADDEMFYNSANWIASSVEAVP